MLFRQLCSQRSAACCQAQGASARPDVLMRWRTGANTHQLYLCPHSLRWLKHQRPAVCAVQVTVVQLGST